MATPEPFHTPRALPFPVHVHPIPPTNPKTYAYERRHSNSAHCDNALVFIGGLGSGPHTTHYLGPLNDALESASLKGEDGVKYGLWELRMRSSYTAFGYASLKDDVEDLGELVVYLKAMGMKAVVLVGSSSGCQAIMTYATTVPAPPQVDGYIMQAPTSDRETAGLLMPQDVLSASLQHAEALIAKGEEGTIMAKSLIPSIITSPVTAYRWHSLISVGGDDDFFSSDLSVSTLLSTFGKLDRPTVILMSEKDEMVPATVDKEALLGRWVNAIPNRLASGRCQVLQFDADHELTGETAMRCFVETVVRFLEEVDGKTATPL